MPDVKGTVSKGLNIGIKAFFNYETDKIVQINSFKIGIINRLIQLCILAYLIGYVLVWKKGYQSTDDVVSGVITKVKGISYVNSSLYPPEYNGVWDVQSIVVPPMENNAFFVTTNLIITRGQKRGQCPEDDTILGANCTMDSDCQTGKLMLLGHGALTGRCVNATRPEKGRVCEVYAWCPVENDTLINKKQPLFDNIPEYTVLIKNSIEYPRFKVKRRNVLDSYSNEQLQNCSEDAVLDPHCPVIRLSTIFQQADVKYDYIGIQGAVIGIHITWNCDLDHGVGSCNPEYSFRRLDSPETKIAKGWNYRYANEYYINGTLHRDLYKAYGIRFLIFVSGTAGKFDFIPLTMNIGSGLALLGLATLLCDMIVLYCVRKRDKYRCAKYDNINEDDLLRRLIGESIASQSDYGTLNDNRDQGLSDVPAVTVHHE